MIKEAIYLPNVLHSQHRTRLSPWSVSIIVVMINCLISDYKVLEN